MKQSYWLFILYAALLIPLSLGYFIEIIIIVFSLLLLPFFLNKLENGIILLPIFIYMPIGMSFLMGIQLSEIGVLLLFLVFLATVIHTKRKDQFETPALLPISLFILAALLSTVNATYMTASIKNILKMVEAFIIVFYITINYIEKKETLQSVFLMIVVGGTLASLFGLYQFRVGGEATMGLERRIFGLLGGGYGAFLGTSIVCAICFIFLGEKTKEKYVSLFCIPILSVALVLHQTRAWFLATGVALIFIVFQIGWKKKLIKFIFVLSVVVLVVFGILGTHLIGFAPKPVTEFATEKSFQLGLSPTQHQGKYLSIMIRLFIWWNGLNIYLQHPVFGFGIGNLRFSNMMTAQLGSPAEEGVGYIDNHYLNILYETGILGITAWLVLMVILFRSSKRLLRLAVDPEWKAMAVAVVGSLIVFFTGGFFWCLTVVHEMTVMLAFLMGLLFAGLRLKNSSVQSV